MLHADPSVYAADSIIPLPNSGTVTTEQFGILKGSGIRRRS